MPPTGPTLLRIFRQQCGAYLALIALALQLAASFGHVHARNFAFENLAGLNAGEAHYWRGPTGHETASQTPGNVTDDDDRCTICFSGFLLATSFIPDATQPSSSFDLTDAGHPLALTFDGVLEPHRAPFQSRAPPVG